jgi:hypothetical protein
MFTQQVIMTVTTQLRHEYSLTDLQVLQTGDSHVLLHKRRLAEFGSST